MSHHTKDDLCHVDVYLHDDCSQPVLRIVLNPVAQDLRLAVHEPLRKGMHTLDPVFVHTICQATYEVVHADCVRVSISILPFDLFLHRVKRRNAWVACYLSDMHRKQVRIVRGVVRKPSSILQLLSGMSIDIEGAFRPSKHLPCETLVDTFPIPPSILRIVGTCLY